MAPENDKKLRTGFTSGAAVAAAVKGALYLLTTDCVKSSVHIDFIGGGGRCIAIHSCFRKGNKAVCTVIKDAGDDPDVTHKAEFGATVSMLEEENTGVHITGGKGVGTVTKPGLEIPPGNPAINPGPQHMIRTAVADVFSDVNQMPCSVYVEAFVLNGDKLAKKTLNNRLGIVGGISILGTTGIVRPMSHEAYIATIKSALSVARASGIRRVFFTTGRRSERYAQQLWKSDKEEAFIQMGDFFKKSLVLASQMAFDVIVLTVFFGKAVKMAYGVPHTHAAKSDMCMKMLAGWVDQITHDKKMSHCVLAANTARESFYLVRDKYPEVIDYVGFKMIDSAEKFIGNTIRIRSVILDFDGKIVFDSEKTNRVY